MARTVVEILDKSLNKLAEVKALYPINNQGIILRYSQELSDYGKCTFRISTQDPFFTTFGDIIDPHTYHIRLMRDGTKVWQGAIVDNVERNKNYIEIGGLEYEYYLDKVLIRRDAETVAGDGKNNYRTFSSGTMAAAVLDIVTKAKTDFGTNHPLGNMVVSSSNIDNPNYPPGFTNADGNALTGPWSFSSFVNLQFDYHSVLYVLKAFGIYTNCDFELDETLTFYFKTFLGNKANRLTFEYGTFGNVIDYNAPRLGKRMANDLWGIAADDAGKILHVNQRDEASIQARGLLQDAQAFADVKAKNFLKTRVSEQLQFLTTPEVSPINLLMNEKAYPIGQFDLGDIVRVKIKDNIIDVNEPRRIVGITINAHNTGRELITVQTNKPRDKDIGV